MLTQSSWIERIKSEKSILDQNFPRIMREFYLRGILFYWCSCAHSLLNSEISMYSNYSHRPSSCSQDIIIRLLLLKTATTLAFIINIQFLINKGKTLQS